MLQIYSDMEQLEILFSYSPLWRRGKKMHQFFFWIQLSNYYKWRLYLFQINLAQAEVKMAKLKVNLAKIKLNLTKYKIKLRQIEFELRHFDLRLRQIDLKKV